MNATKEKRNESDELPVSRKHETSSFSEQRKIFSQIVNRSGDGPVSCRIDVLPLGEVFLPGGMALEQYFDLVGPVAQTSIRTPIAVVLWEGPGKYRMIRPVDGAVPVLHSPKSGDFVKAVIYEIDSDLIKDVLACVTACNNPVADFFEISNGFHFLNSKVQLTQKDLIAWFGVAQPTIANKLRLASLSPAVQKAALASGLSERHCRALLSIETEEMQLYTAKLIVRRRIGSKRVEQLGKILKNVSLSELGKEAYVDLINKSLKDLNFAIDKERSLLIKTLQSNVNRIKSSGIPATIERTETDNAIEIIIKIAK